MNLSKDDVIRINKKTPYLESKNGKNRPSKGDIARVTDVFDWGTKVRLLTRNGKEIDEEVEDPIYHTWLISFNYIEKVPELERVVNEIEDE